MIFKRKRDILFVVLASFFVTNAIVAELISSKLISIGPFTMIVGIIPWPVVFLSTDLMNEFYGKTVVRRMSIITCFMIAYAFLIIYVAMKIPSVAGTPVSDEVFNKVFGQSLMVIVGSICAFLVSQLLDSYIFWFFRNITGGKMIWLRSTGSTVISQLIDSYVVLGIGFWLPGTFTFDQFIHIGFNGYVFKLIIALALTPLIYVGHKMIDKYLGDKEAHDTIIESAEESLEHTVEE